MSSIMVAQTHRDSLFLVGQSEVVLLHNVEVGIHLIQQHLPQLVLLWGLGGTEYCRLNTTSVK